MRQLLKNVCKKKVERIDNELQLSAQAELRNREEQLSIIAESVSNGQKIDKFQLFNIKFQLFCDSSEDKMHAVTCICSQTKRN